MRTALLYSCLVVWTFGCGVATDPGEQFVRDETVLVCVTARPPGDLAPKALDDLYDLWMETAIGRPGHVTNYLFRFEPDGNGAPKHMFALVFREQPNGMSAAAIHRDEEYVRFRARLEEAGFTEISLQSNLLLVDNSNEDYIVD